MQKIRISIEDARLRSVQTQHAQLEDPLPVHPGVRDLLTVRRVGGAVGLRPLVGRFRQAIEAAQPGPIPGETPLLLTLEIEEGEVARRKVREAQALAVVGERGEWRELRQDPVRRHPRGGPRAAGGVQRSQTRPRG